MVHANDRELSAAIAPAKTMNLDMVIATPFFYSILIPPKK
jgi:hypothetical protein